MLAQYRADVGQHRPGIKPAQNAWWWVAGGWDEGSGGNQMLEVFASSLHNNRHLSVGVLQVRPTYPVITPSPIVPLVSLSHAATMMKGFLLH